MATNRCARLATATRPRLFVASRLAGVVIAAVLLASCGGGSATSDSEGAVEAPAPPAVVLTDMQPMTDGFAFANFPSFWYPEEFIAEDVVAMFGADESVCVDGVADPCELTAEAAAFARMVNQSRAAGHCEGLVAVAQARFNERSDPPTAELGEDEETIKAIMRAFATQFIPEVRTEISQWLGRSLADKIQALQTSLAEGTLRYSLGVYVEEGGHAVLPYAIEYLTPTRPRIMVYDSNWPGRNRWVDVDLETETWSFSFGGEDPDADTDLWTGGANRMDLTSIDSRTGSCPFCSSDVGVAKNVLLVRSTDLNWSVEADGATVDPESPGDDDAGVVLTPLKGQNTSGRPSYDYLIEVPVDADGTRAKLNLPGTSSVFALTPSGIAQISTPGNPDVPVEVGATSFASADPEVTLSLASGNLVATASGPSASLEIAADGLKAAVTTEDGQVVELEVTPETPAAKIVADPDQGGIEVLAQAADGVVEKREIAADGTETVTIETTPLNLNATTWEAPEGLESVAIPSLPSPGDRNLNNPDYEVDEPYTPPADAVSTSDTIAPSITSLPPSTTSPPVTTTVPPTTTSSPPVTTTVPPTTTSSPPVTTTVPPTTTVAHATTTTTPPTTTTVARPTTTTTVPPTTTTTTTVPSTTTTTTTVPSTTTTTTTVPSTTTTTTTVPLTTTTTTAPPVTPSLSLSDLPAATVGDGPMTLIVISNSPAPITFAVSDPAVATIAALTPTSARIGIVGAGATEISVSQPAVGGFTPVSETRSLTVLKRTQSPLAIVDVTGTAGSSVTLTSSGGSGTGDVTFALSSGANDGCTLVGALLTRTTAGTCTVVATKATDSQYLERASDPLAIDFLGTTRVLLYDVISPTRSGNSIQYAADHGIDADDAQALFDAQSRSIQRITYRMEVSVSGTLRFAEVSFDPWDVNLTASDLRVPDPNNGLIVQKFVENLTVVSNMDASVSAISSGVTEAVGRRGFLELWAIDYATAPSVGGPTRSAGPTDRFDYNDSPSGGSYGSFQVHDVTVPGTGSTVLAWNRHGSLAPDIGLGDYIGNNNEVHQDWTFASMHGASLGTVDWRLQVFVEAPSVPIAASGGTITDVTVDGVVYRTHTFTTIGAQSFIVTNAGTDGVVEYLVVGGGGGGGRSGPAGAGGGGGGGAVVTGTMTLATGIYDVTVGAGGLGDKAGTHVTGGVGQDSGFDVVLALGGGGGGGGNTAIPGSSPSSRATGGGAGATSGEAMTGAVGTEGAGFGGGDSTAARGGGGGGARGLGAAPVGNSGGAGGSGQSVTISGQTVSYGGGGGGGCQLSDCTAGAGTDGGGSGGAMSATGLAGVAGTGGGGGGAGGHVTGGGGGDGGSGVVIIRYRVSP